MKNEISILVAALFLSAGLVACSPEKPESEKTVDGKAGGTNELVIANSDANALPSQEEDFSDETKAKLKKLREEAAILKAEADLKAANEQLNQETANSYSLANSCMVMANLAGRYVPDSSQTSDVKILTMRAMLDDIQLNSSQLANDTGTKIGLDASQIAKDQYVLTVKYSQEEDMVIWKKMRENCEAKFVSVATKEMMQKNK